MKKSVLIFAILAHFTFVARSFAGPGWLFDWDYRKPVTISNSGAALTDYQVLITTDTAVLISAGKMRSDCGDLRSTDSDGTLMSYWIESGCNSANTKIWTKVPSIAASSTKTIYLYFGNPSTSSVANSTATFELFDNFDGGSLAPAWSSAGSPTVAGSEVTIDDSAPDDSIAQGSYLYDIAVKFRAYFSGAGNNMEGGFGGLSGGNPRAQINNNDVAGLTAYNYVTGATTTGIDSYIDAYHIYEISWLSGENKYWVDDSLVATHTTQVPNAARPVAFYADWSILKVDWVLVRKYASPEPTTSTGAEEFGTLFFHLFD